MIDVRTHLSREMVPGGYAGVVTPTPVDRHGPEPSGTVSSTTQWRAGSARAPAWCSWKVRVAIQRAIESFGIGIATGLKTTIGPDAGLIAQGENPRER